MNYCTRRRVWGECIEMLMAMARTSRSQPAIVAAIREILDRGYGKAPRPLVLETEKPVLQGAAFTFVVEQRLDSDNKSSRWAERRKYLRVAVSQRMRSDRQADVTSTTLHQRPKPSIQYWVARIPLPQRGNHVDTLASSPDKRLDSLALCCPTLCLAASGGRHDGSSEWRRRGRLRKHQGARLERQLAHGGSPSNALNHGG